jgi:SAM-dependent methyltransferase
MSAPLLTKERQEIEFWRDDPLESPGAASVENLINKLGEARNFLRKLERFRDIFTSSPRILELGGGQGWASCLVKSKFPAALVTASDISPYAIVSARLWEELFKVRLDGTFACRSYEIPLDDASVDLVFCFAAAHHFRAHRRTLGEIRRVLAPGGSCLYLYEPSCTPWLHQAAQWRVNRKRPAVPEDVLVYERIRWLANSAGLGVRLEFDTSPLNRGVLEQNYYLALTRLPFLTRILPCTVDYIFTKRAES